MFQTIDLEGVFHWAKNIHHSFLDRRESVVFNQSHFPVPSGSKAGVSAVWNSVPIINSGNAMIINSGNANVSKTCLFTNFKNSCKFRGIDLDPTETGQMHSR